MRFSRVEPLSKAQSAAVSINRIGEMALRTLAVLPVPHPHETSISWMLGDSTSDGGHFPNEK